MKLSKGRDLRKKGWFWLDNEYLNGYAKYLGPTISCVYISLCRHADSHQSCFPKLETVAEELGITKSTVIKSIKVLEDWNIIEVTREYDTNQKKQKVNVYLLLDKEFWKSKPEPSVQITPGARYRAEYTDYTRGRVYRLHRKETHINTKDLKTIRGTIKGGAGDAPPSEKDKDSRVDTLQSPKSLIPDVIKLFESVNPACKRYYGNPTQRKACQDLLDTYGLEELTNVINFLPVNNSTPYKPKANTPLQLWEKYQSIKDAWAQEKNIYFNKQVEQAKVAFS